MGHVPLVFWVPGILINPHVRGNLGVVCLWREKEHRCHFAGSPILRHPSGVKHPGLAFFEAQSQFHVGRLRGSTHTIGVPRPQFFAYGEHTDPGVETDSLGRSFMGLNSWQNSPQVAGRTRKNNHVEITSALVGGLNIQQAPTTPPFPFWTAKHNKSPLVT